MKTEPKGDVYRAVCEGKNVFFPKCDFYIFGRSLESISINLRMSNLLAAFKRQESDSEGSNYEEEENEFAHGIIFSKLYFFQRKSAIIQTMKLLIKNLNQRLKLKPWNTKASTLASMSTPKTINLQSKLKRKRIIIYIEERKLLTKVMRKAKATVNRLSGFLILEDEDKGQKNKEGSQVSPRN